MKKQTSELFKLKQKQNFKALSTPKILSAFFIEDLIKSCQE